MQQHNISPFKKPGSTLFLGVCHNIEFEFIMSYRLDCAALNVYRQQQISYQPRLSTNRLLLIEKCPSLAEMTTVLEAISSDGIMAEAGNSPRETRGQAIPPFWAEMFWGGGNEFWQCLRLASSLNLGLTSVNINQLDKLCSGLLSSSFLD